MSIDNLASESAERAVIAKLLAKNELIDQVSWLEEKHFFFPETRYIFSLIMKNLRKNVSVDELTMLSEYKIKSPKSSDFELPIERYAKIIENKAIFRSLVDISKEIDRLVATEAESRSCVDLISSMIYSISDNNAEKEPKKLIESLETYKNTLEHRASGIIKPISTGFPFLDKKLGGGLEKGTLTIVAGRPGMGKSALGIAFAINMSRDRGVLFLSMEMPETQVNDRIVSILGSVPVSDLRSPNSAESLGRSFNGLKLANKEAGLLNLYVDEQSGLSIQQVYSKLRKVKRSVETSVLIIDQLSFITGGDSKNLWEATGEYTRGLIKLAKDLNVAVVLLCQLNRECEKRPNKRPMLSDLALSGSIEQDASNIIFLYRDVVYDPETSHKDVAEIIVAKQRQGSTGTTHLKFDEDHTKFDNFAFDYVPDTSLKSFKGGFYGE